MIHVTCDYCGATAPVPRFSLYQLFHTTPHGWWHRATPQGLRDACSVVCYDALVAQEPGFPAPVAAGHKEGA